MGYKVESYMGAVFLIAVAVLAMIIVWGLFTGVKSDIEAVNVNIRFERGSKYEQILIDRWIKAAGIYVPPDVDRYEYVRKKYPTKEWLDY